MSNKREYNHRNDSDVKLLVPVMIPTESHTIKYFILNEEPKGYICEKGCVHKYPPSLYKNRSRTSGFSSTKESLRSKNTNKRTLSPPVRYLPSGNTLSILQKNSSLFSTESMTPYSVTPGKILISSKSSTLSPLTKLNASSLERAGSADTPDRHSLKCKLHQNSLTVRNAVRRSFSSDDEPAMVIREKEYDKESDVFTRLYPYVQTPKSNLEISDQNSPGCKLHEESSPLRHLRPFNNTDEPKGEERNVPLEKEYYKENDVFSRLYPYKQIPKTVPDPITAKMDWQSYHRLSTIYDFLDELEGTYPSICTVGIIGHSIEGRELKLLKISNGNANNSAVWIDAGIHAREWIGPAVNTYLANYIARNFEKLPISCTNKDWYFVPVVNPDGYEYSHTKNRMWRKNRAWHGGKCVGVDLNRNFSVAWGGKGSSDDPKHCFYRGTRPFSEPESCALKNVLEDSQLPFKVYITLHAFGELIIFPLAHSDDLCPDYIRLLNGAAAMSRAIYNTHGTTYRVGVSKDVLYCASGTSNDWCYSALGIPYCYLIELRSKKERFKLPETEIMDSGLEILNSVKALMEFVDIYPLERNSGDHKPQPRSRYMVNIWKEEHSTMDVMVDGPRIGQLAGLLHERGIPYALAVTDVRPMLAVEQGIGSSRKSISSCPAMAAWRDLETYCQFGLKLLSTAIVPPPNDTSPMDWSHYHRLSTIYTFMDNLAREYPYLVTLQTIGKSSEGRNIIMMKVSNGKVGNAGVWIDGSIHPREWISAAVVTFVANTLVRTFHDMPSSVTNKDWYILPVLNPDGYEYTHTHDRMWRKNRAHYGESVGVDLNRNFSWGWGENGEEGSSGDPGNIFFRGPEPFSEPESVAVRDAIVGADVPFKVFLSLHSYGEVIIFPWGYTSAACPSYVDLLEGGTTMAKAIFESSGRVYKVGSTKDLMYYAAGTSIDWSYGALNIPYCYMIELRGKKHRFLLPAEQILSTAQEVWNGIMKLMDFVDHRCKSTQR